MEKNCEKEIKENQEINVEECIKESECDNKDNDNTYNKDSKECNDNYEI